MKKIMKIILSTLLVLSLIVACLSLYIGNYVYEFTLNPYAKENISTYMHIDTTHVQENHLWLDQNSNDTYITSDDGLSLHGYTLNDESTSHIYMIMVHGYRGDGASIVSPIKKMRKTGYHLLVPDLRGHGQSEGNFYGMGWLDRLDMMKWINYIIGKDSEAQIVMYGVSMGAATVMCTIGEKMPSNIICAIEDCGYTSVWDVFKKQIQLGNDWKNEAMLFLSSELIHERTGYYLQDASPLKAIKKSQTPTLFIHGSLDSFVPCDMVYELYESCPTEKELLVIEGADHANSCSVDSDIYYKTLKDFIAKYIR